MQLRCIKKRRLTMITKKPTALVILDGFGYRTDKKNNAIAQAHTPTLNEWFAHYPWALLKASGKAVGLPEGFIGNSEVGHITIGSGRITPQPVSIIHDAIISHHLESHAVLTEKLHALAQTGKPLHIMGLLSDAGIHSHTELLYTLIAMAQRIGIKKTVIHAFLDGRDTAPQSGITYLENLATYLKKLGYGIIGSIHGRFYAMDRDRNWDRIEKSYRILTEKQTGQSLDWKPILTDAYTQNINDEFIVPIQLTPEAVIEPGCGIIFTNFRPDRARQLTSCFMDTQFKKFAVHQLNLAFFITPFAYNHSLNTNVLFEAPVITNTLKDVLSSNEKNIFSISETEKYAHVTYFFAGGRERIFPNEIRILVPSIVTQTYVQLPAMSACHITQSVIKSLKKTPRDFYVINYPNADMVGHSGNLKATIKAIECLDEELKKLYEAIVINKQGTMFITGDHGKAEDMFDAKTNSPRTAHTTNPVPFLMLRADLKDSGRKLPLTQLSDIAPFILQEMGVPIPAEMGTNFEHSETSEERLRS